MKKTLSPPGFLTGQFAKNAFALLVMFLLTGTLSFAQTRFVQAPLVANGSSSISRGPNGSADFHRANIIYLGSEMPAVPATNITSVGFSILTPAATAATGTIKLYMVNTTDATNNRGTTWASILTTPTAMTLVYDGPLTIPAAAGYYNIALTTPFAYTGGNFYLAYEWTATTKSAASATYNTNTDIPTNGVLSATGTALPATLSLASPHRPVLRIGFTPLPNDLAVAQIYTLGKLPTLASTNPHVVRAAIVNTGASTKTNVTVSLAVTGANTVNSTATIATLAGGDTTIVSFPAYTATTAGTNTITVSVPTDDNATNNSKTTTQIVTTGEISYAEGATPVHTTALRPTGTNGTLVAKFNVNAQTFLESVNMMISFHTATVGQTIYAVVLNSSGTQIGRSADYVVTTGDLSTLKNFVLNTPVTLPAGDFYVGMAVVPSATVTFFPLGVQDEVPVRPNTFYTTPIAGGTPVLLNSNYRLIIEPVLANCLAPVVPTVTPAGSATYCTGSSVTLTAATTSPGVTYQWFRNGAPIAGATTSTLAASTNGNYSVSAINGACASFSSITAVSNGSPAVPVVTAGGPTTFCQGEDVELTSTTIPGVTYQWNLNGTPIAGSTAANHFATAAGVYTITVTAPSTCTSVSTGTTITVNPTPAAPVVTQNGGTLTSNYATGNQWNLNGVAIPGATGQTLVTTANGNYTVEVTVNGCVSNRSNLIFVTNTGLADNLAGMSVQVYPNPASGSFSVKLNGYQQDAAIALYSLTGQQILTNKVKAGQSAKNIDVKTLAAGTYLLKVTSEKGVQVTRLVIE